jgi:hypothetical protein
MRRIRSGGLVNLRVLGHLMIINFMDSMCNKFVDLRNNSLGAFYVEYIVKLDNKTGSSIPIKQIEDFFT